MFDCKEQFNTNVLINRFFRDEHSISFHKGKNGFFITRLLRICKIILLLTHKKFFSYIAEQCIIVILCLKQKFTSRQSKEIFITWLVYFKNFLKFISTSVMESLCHNYPTKIIPSVRKFDKKKDIHFPYL